MLCVFAGVLHVYMQHKRPHISLYSIQRVRASTLSLTRTHTPIHTAGDVALPAPKRRSASPSLVDSQDKTMFSETTQLSMLSKAHTHTHISLTRSHRDSAASSFAAGFGPTISLLSPFSPLTSAQNMQQQQQQQQQSEKDSEVVTKLNFETQRQLAGDEEEEVWRVKSSEWKMKAQLISKDVAISRLRNEPKSQLQDIIQQLENELSSRQLRTASLGLEAASSAPEQPHHPTRQTQQQKQREGQHDGDNGDAFHEHDASAQDSGEIVCQPVAKATFTWLRTHVHRHVALCTSEMQAVQSEMKQLAYHYEKTGAALVSVEIALEDALAREASAAVSHAQHERKWEEDTQTLKQALEEAHAQYKQEHATAKEQKHGLDECMVLRAEHLQQCLGDSERFASKCAALQYDMLELYAAAHEATEENLGAVGLSVGAVEAAEHPSAGGRRHIRIELVSVASTAAAEVLLQEGTVLHQIDNQPLEVPTPPSTRRGRDSSFPLCLSIFYCPSPHTSLCAPLFFSFLSGSATLASLPLPCAMCSCLWGHVCCVRFPPRCVSALFEPVLCVSFFSCFVFVYALCVCVYLVRVHVPRAVPSI